MTGETLKILDFLGTPIISLTVATIFVIAKKTDKFYEITNDTLKSVSLILPLFFQVKTTALQAG